MFAITGNGYCKSYFTEAINNLGTLYNRFSYCKQAAWEGFSHYSQAALQLLARITRIAARTFALLLAAACGAQLPLFTSLGFIAAWIAPTEVQRALNVYTNLFRFQIFPGSHLLWGAFCLLTWPATVAVAAFASGVALKILCSPALPGCTTEECSTWLSYFFS